MKRGFLKNKSLQSNTKAPGLSTVPLSSITKQNVELCAGDITRDVSRDFERQVIAGIAKKGKLSSYELGTASKGSPSYGDLEVGLMFENIQIMVRRGGRPEFHFCTLPPPMNEHDCTGPSEESTACLLWPFQKDEIVSMPSFPRPPAGSQHLTRVYEVQQDPLRGGKRMVATHPLTCGDLIIAERPIIVYPTAIPIARGSRNSHPDAYLSQLLQPDTCDDHRRRQYLDLHNCYEVNDESPLLTGIANTNAIHVGQLPGPHQNASYSGVANEISRINHSCVPNANVFFDLPSFSFEVRAIRSIASGEEVTISYCPCHHTRKQRQSELNDSYDFTCICPICSLDQLESDRLDVLRAQADAASRKFNTKSMNLALDSVIYWSADRTLPDDHLLKASMDVVNLLDEAQICDLEAYSYHATILCAVHLALGDLEEAKAWGRKTYRTDLARWGETKAQAFRCLEEDMENSTMKAIFWKRRFI